MYLLSFQNNTFTEFIHLSIAMFRLNVSNDENIMFWNSVSRKFVYFIVSGITDSFISFQSESAYNL